MDEDTKVFDLEKEEETIEEATPVVEETIEENTPNKKTKKEKKKNKVPFKEKWRGYSKKKKIIIICLTIVVLALITVGTILVVKGRKKPVKKEKTVIIENKNYRYENGILIFYDKNKKEIGKYTCKNKSDKKCHLAYYSLEEELDNTRYLYEDDKEVSFQTPIVSNKYVFIFDNESKDDKVITLYDIKENKKKEIYTDIKKAFNDYVFIVKNDEGKYGVISLKDDLANIIKFKYDYLGCYDSSNNEYFVTKIDDKYLILDKDENELSKSLKGKITGYTNDYIKVKNESSYVVYDYKGNVILDDGLSFVSFIDKYIIAVKNNALFIYDKKTKLNYDGIKLFNEDYIRKYIYDKNNKLLEIKNAYEVSFDDKNITVKTYNDKEENTTKLNLLEAALNSKLEYVSYVGGKLYFYSDSEKQNLIGSYPCKNKNSVTSADSVLNNCYIAKEKETYIPIINERFVFVNDNLDTNKQSIYLYDLKDNNTLSNYLDVETNITTTNMLYTTIDLNVIALSAKKNKYGVINISNNEVKKVLEFDKEKITAKEGYFIVNKTSGTYIVYDSKGSLLSSEFGQEIVKYDASTNFVTTMLNNKYKIYKSNGEEVTKKFYEQIDTYRNYIVVIDSKKLDVLGLDGNYYCDLCKDITIYNDNNNAAYITDDNGITILKGTNIVEQINFKEQDNGQE